MPNCPIRFAERGEWKQNLAAGDPRAGFDDQPSRDPVMVVEEQVADRADGAVGRFDRKAA
jgi:hypothetical protein